MIKTGDLVKVNRRFLGTSRPNSFKALGLVLQVQTTVVPDTDRKITKLKLLVSNGEIRIFTDALLDEFVLVREA